MADGLNGYRQARVAQVLEEFRMLQYYIAAAPVNPENMDDYYTEGWAALRQCAIDGQHILNCGADITVPQAAGGPDEQARVELQQVLLDAYGRRHEAQKIRLRQAAAQRWVEWRDSILMGGRPHSGNQSQLRACDQQLRSEIACINDQNIYSQLQTADYNLGRWTDEDPSLRRIQQWLRSRRRS